MVEDLGQFDVAGVAVWAKPHLIFRSPSAGWVILDWKTGREGARSQLALYAGYARDGLRLTEASGTFECRSVNVSGGAEASIFVGPAEIDLAYRAVVASGAAMQGLLRDASKNAPADAAAFARNGGDPTCRRCEFREICPGRAIAPRAEFGAYAGSQAALVMAGDMEA